MTNIFLAHFSTLMVRHPTINTLLKQVQSYGDAYVLGGAVRDIYENKTPRDYDIMIHTSSDLDFSSFGAVVNNYGGNKIQIDSYEFDIWTSYRMQGMEKKEKTIENVLQIPFYTLDAVYYSFSDHEYSVQHFVDSLEKKELELLNGIHPRPFDQLTRSFVLMKKYHLQPSSTLSSYMKEHIQDIHTFLEESLSYQKKHYKQIVLPKNEILHMYQTI